MKRKLNISLLLPVIGLLVWTSNSQAQQVATATARVTLTVIPAAGINFTQTNSTKTSSSVNQSNGSGITLHTTSNVAVMMNSSSGKKMLNDNHVGQGVTKTITSKELNDVSKVEIIYLGS
ncbi:MAG TPA: hypothetical protein VLX91_07030 [Candidatus Acidoferrales bacterium]|nr:hypothetical protein [Candidatus Acidoferrales bacterium]